VWPDPAAAAVFRSVGAGEVWALAWVDGALVAPLALLKPAGLFQKPQLIHLVPGHPATPLAT
jgi:hypothetical protein